MADAWTALADYLSRHDEARTAERVAPAARAPTLPAARRRRLETDPAGDGAIG